MPKHVVGNRRIGNRRFLICGDFQCNPSVPGKLTDILLAALPYGVSVCDKDQQFTYIHNSGSTSNIDHVVTNFPLMERVGVNSDHTCSDHLGLSFCIPFQSAATRAANTHFTKAEWKKIDTVLYQYTCDTILSKIKAPYQLLLHGVRDPVALNFYCEEICHALKTAEKLAVPSQKVRPGSQKPGWDKCPLVKKKRKNEQNCGTIFGKSPTSPDQGWYSSCFGARRRIILIELKN